MGAVPVTLGIVVALATVVSAGGCAQPLLSPTDERTPFDRYDSVRNEYAKQYVENEFGRLKPNLRGRLSPR